MKYVHSQCTANKSHLQSTFCMSICNVHSQCTANKHHFKSTFKMSIGCLHLQCTLPSINCFFILQQATVEKHVMQNAQLSELLHMVHEKPIMVRDENSFLMQQNNDNLNPDVDNSPKFVGKPTNLNFRTRQGMPKHIKQDENDALFRVINTNKTSVWAPPIQACKSITITLTDRQQLQDDAARYVSVILRAMPYFHGKPSYDNVKVAVEYDTGAKLHFGKCVVFLKDSLDEYFILLQWYDQVGRQPLDSVSGLVQLVLRPPNVTGSYSIMPITSIANGAIITCSENKLWVLLSPREAYSYELTNM